MPFEGLFSFAWPTRVTVETIKLYLIVNYSVRFITPVDNCINLQLLFLTIFLAECMEQAK